MDILSQLPNNNNILLEIYKETKEFTESIPKNKQNKIKKLIEKYEDKNSIEDLIEVNRNNYEKLKEELIKYKIEKIEYIKSLVK
jgi:hypothetical protein